MITRNHKANWNAFCSEPLELVENYMAAKADNFAGWCIHHKLEIQPDGTRMSRQELKDQGLYYGRPASELVFMKVCEHVSLHHKDKVISAETRNKLSALHKGKNLPAEHRQKIAEAFTGKHWWNNGISSKLAKECPGPEWKPGRILKP